VKLEQLYGVTLDDDYRTMMVDDVRRQIDGRIREYLQRLQGVNQAGDTRAIEEDITFKVKNDVQTALHNYFNNLPRQGGTNDENGSHQ
jgi:spore germination protein PC